MFIEDVQSYQQHIIRAAKWRIYLVGLLYLTDSPCTGNLKIIYQPVGGKWVPIWHTWNPAPHTLWTSSAAWGVQSLSGTFL